MKRKEVENNTILMALTGSHSYGTNIKDSDYDYKGIFIAPKEYRYTLRNVEQKDSGWIEEGNGNFKYLDNNKDTVIYDIIKYIKLAANCNPNILELLFEKENFYTFLSPIGEKLIANRNLFLSKKVKHSYAGYAYAQIKKIKTHRHWLFNPIENKPIIENYTNNSSMILNKRELNAFLEYLFLLMKGNIEFFEEEKELYELINYKIDYKGLLKNKIMPEIVKDYVQKFTGSSNMFMEKLRLTQEYYNDLKEYKNYQSWKKNRNPKRAKLEEKCGYDSKHASHCVRLLIQGSEILLNKTLEVYRENDKEYLLDIRLGKLSYEELIEKCELLFNKLEKSNIESTLPDKVNIDKINNLLFNLLDNYYCNTL